MKKTICLNVLVFLFSKLIASNSTNLRINRVDYFHYQFTGNFSFNVKVEASGFIIGSDSIITLNSVNVKIINCKTIKNSKQFSLLLGPGILRKKMCYYARSYIKIKSKVHYSSSVRFDTYNQEYEIGERVFGGQLLYVFSPRDSLYINGEIHGIILADTIMSAFVLSNIVSDRSLSHHNGGTGDRIGDGKNNTIKLYNEYLSQKGNEEKKVNSTVYMILRTINNTYFSGYNDWFLPSLSEIGLLWFHSNLFNLKSRPNFLTSSKSRLKNLFVYSFDKTPKIFELNVNLYVDFVPMRYF